MTQGHDGASIRWQVQGASGFCWRAWDDEHVVFHPTSGDTHLLNPFTAEVLRALEECPASACELTQLFAPALGTKDEPALRRQMEDLLARFHDLGLIEANPRMNVAALSPTALARRLSHTGLRLQAGPFVFSIRSTVPRFGADFRLLYGDFPLAGEDELADFHVSLTRPAGPRRWLFPQSVFVFGDGTTPFEPYPLGMALPLFEWGLNWCVWDHAHQFLILHAAVLERDGQALLLSAPSGSGKSTLCAGLVQRGWRLLSDELALVRPQDGCLAPLPRPICLKNESIRVIREFAPRAVLGPVCQATPKGTVAHVRPPSDSVARAQETALPAWVVFPRHQAGAAASLTPVSRGRAFLRLIEHAFNYSLLGVRGFETLAGLIDASSCYEFRYGDLEEAVALLNTLVPSPALAHAASDS